MTSSASRSETSAPGSIEAAGVGASPNGANGNLADLVRDAARRAPERVALVSGQRQLTWAEVDAEVDAAATGFAADDLVAGFRVALALTNSIEFVTLYFGALRAGLVAVPLPAGGRQADATVDEVVAMISQVRARLVAVDDSSAATVRAAARQLGSRAPHIVVVGIPPEPGETTYADFVAGTIEGRDEPATPVDPQLLAVLVHTSGTSTTPRAAMLTHAALLANLEQAAAVDPPLVRSDDVVLGLLPLFHIYGLNACLGMVARAAATLVLVERFDPDATLRLIAEAGVTNVPAVPSVFQAWAGRADLAERLAGVRLLLSGAAPLPDGLSERYRAVLGQPIHQAYGLTESAPGITSTLGSDRVKPGSVGRAFPGVEVRIVDERGAEVERGDDDLPGPGEVQVRGEQLFSGYWPDGAGGPDGDGWFATGDLGYLDDDRDLFLVDRVRELILVSGFNVYPHEVETVIGELEQVAEAAVIGVPAEPTGEAVRAYVVPRAGADVTPAMVRAHCARRLARFKCPTEVEIVAELPRSAAGKIRKTRLRAPEERS